MTVSATCLLGAAGVADAQRHSGAGELLMAARFAAESDPAPDRDRLWQSAGHVDLRGLYGRRVAFVAGFGFELGGEVPAGFAYDVQLSPLGVALRFGRRGWIGATAGVGVSGVVDRLPVAFAVPVTGFAATDLSRHVRISARARAGYLFGADSRDSGTVTDALGDELELEVGVAIGKRESQFRALWSDGTYLGVFVREHGGRRLVGVTLAVSMVGVGGF